MLLFECRLFVYVVNVGLVFGSIGFVVYGIYCVIKFVLKGWMEVMYREFSDSKIKFYYLVLCVMCIDINDECVNVLNEVLGN